MTANTPLPVDAVVAEVCAACDHHGSPNVVLLAPTGSGKTTRVPPALARHREGLVIVTEPRRVAARAAARRIASEANQTVGRWAGYAVRDDSRMSSETRVLCVTEGVLARRLQDDPFLDGVSAIVFDEVHERSLDLELALTLARHVQREARPDLALVAMSATVEPARLSQWLGGAAIVRCQGRSHPVAIRHAAPAPDRPLEREVAAQVRALLAEVSGDVLVFLPGVGEIERAAAALGAVDADVVALHGGLDAEAQDAVVRPSARRRVILATNVAESSLTVPGVRAVVDTGLARILRFDPAAGLNRLVIERICRSSADQRAGRAGREAPGVCVRMWTSASEGRMAPTLDPELHRADLTGVALQLAEWGERDPAALSWWEPCPPARWADARTTLMSLGALDGDGVTARGRAMARLPLDTRLAVVALRAAELGARHAGAIAASVLAERDILRPLRDGDTPPTGRECDVCDRVAAVLAVEDGARPDPVFADRLSGGAARAVARSARSLERALRGVGDDRAPDWRLSVRRALAEAFPDRVAQPRAGDGRRALAASGVGVALAPDSGVDHAPELIICVDLSPPSRGGDHRARAVSSAALEWFEHRVETTRLVHYDPARDRVVAVRRRTLGAIVLEEAVESRDDAAASSAALAAAAAGALATALALDDPEFARLRARVAWLAQQRPELALPAVDDEAIRGWLPELAFGLRSFAALRKVDLAASLRGRIPYDVRRVLDAEAPESVVIPTGRAARLEYGDGPPVLAARVQELFGLCDTPRVAGGRVPVVVHLLAPNGRPQQVTSDLRSFWANVYPEVRKELRARYPKHAWPDDPWTALPESRPTRRRG
ncbi:MAG: ATP-dependent helicase HrpB [Myxococcales bacterium]|nr:ATP-dependent helicase HrpB [Myxococcales bacterium]MCB9533230.1 ATP-dependent helicase HrpB [Myxococcales bacterium]